MTGSLLRIDIRGRDGQAARRRVGRRARAPTSASACPASPTCSSSPVPAARRCSPTWWSSIEHHVDWIADCLEYLRANGHATIEATDTAADEWVTYVNTIASFTLFPTCNSWYLGANIPGKPRVFMPLPGFPPYVEQCDDVVANGYRGFAIA